MQWGLTHVKRTMHEGKLLRRAALCNMQDTSAAQVACIVRLNEIL